MAEEEQCPEYEEFLEWFRKEAQPHYLKYTAHFVNCPNCQRGALSVKDQVGFDMLRMSEDEIIQKAREALEEEGGAP